jgi:hypothetical protein
MAGKAGSLLLEGALPDLVLEMGYHFTSSVEECRASLLQLGGREVYAATVAKVSNQPVLFLPVAHYGTYFMHLAISSVSDQSGQWIRIRNPDPVG